MCPIPVTQGAKTMSGQVTGTTRYMHCYLYQKCSDGGFCFVLCHS